MLYDIHLTFRFDGFIVITIVYLFACLHLIISLLFLPQNSLIPDINQCLAVSDLCHFGWCMFIYKLLAHFAEMFPQAIDFGTDGINFNRSFYYIKYI